MHVIALVVCGSGHHSGGGARVMLIHVEVQESVVTPPLSHSSGDSIIPFQQTEVDDAVFLQVVSQLSLLE